MKTAMQIAIEKIDKQIKISEVCRIEASKIKDATSMNRYYGMKIALVFMRQELVNLLEMEKQQIFETTNSGRILLLQNPIYEQFISEKNEKNV